MFDPQTGQPVLSPKGGQFQQAVTQLAQAGANPDLIPQLALQMIGSADGQSVPIAGPQVGTQPSVPAPASLGEQAKESFLGPGTYEPGRAGKEISSAASPNAPALGPDEDIQTMLERDFAKAGIQTTDPGPPET